MKGNLFPYTITKIQKNKNDFHAKSNLFEEKHPLLE
jgi:hypothetical protein